MGRQMVYPSPSSSWISSTAPPGSTTPAWPHRGGVARGVPNLPGDRVAVSCDLVADVLIASDADWLRADVRSVLSARDHTVREVTSGVQVLSAVDERLPDLVVLEQSMGNMGGIATCLELHLRE